MPADHTLDVARARVGRTLRGKYRLDRVLGAGGMAAVYVATHRNAKQFAVKMLHPEISLDEGIRARFLREGYLANSVKHPGAVAVLDDDVAEDGSAFLVMELLEGSPVDRVWQEHGCRLPVPLALSIGHAVLDVLVAAHERGIVHRDLKPANLFLTSAGALKVLDFGIARLHDETGSGGTISGATLGTPAFMAPEQALGRSSDIDAQTDLWAVGATLFTLLSGELVHRGENGAQVFVAAATKPARSLATVAPSVPKAITDVIDRAIAFEKYARWPTAAAMRAALHRASQEALGAPIAILPTDALPSGRDGALASGGSSGGSAGTAFGPTVDAGSDPKGAAPRFSTEGALARSARVSLLSRWRGRWVAGAATGCLVVLGGTAAYVAARAPRTTYCAKMVDSIDGPRCVRTVPKEAEARRGMNATYATTTVGGRVTEIRDEIFAGRSAVPEDYVGRTARRALLRAPDGTLREIDSYDSRGFLFEREKLSEGGRVRDITGDDGEPAGLDVVIGETSVTRVVREFDTRGFVTKETFFGPPGKPRADGDGAYGYAYVVGSNGTPTRRTVLGFDGAPGVDRSGAAYLEITRDEPTRVGTVRYFGLDRRPTVMLGIHTFRNRRDADEMNIEETCLDIHDAPADELGVAAGVHGYRYRWNAERRTLDTTLLDEKGQPAPGQANTWTSMRNTFDPLGRRILHEHFDANGNRVRDRHEGATAERLVWGNGDELAADELLDGSEALTQGELGYARQTFVRDERGRSIETRSFDESGHPIAPREGSAIERTTYDQRNLRTSVSYFGADERPTSNAHGVAVERAKFDRHRNQVELAYFGADGQPIASDEGFALRRDTYDADDDLALESFFDAAGAPVIVHGDYATRRITSDERGLTVAEEYLDVHGERILKKAGYAAVKYERDRNGDVVVESYLGRHDEPVLAVECGCARKRLSYDVHRRLAMTALFDVADLPVSSSERWSVERVSYDDRGLEARVDHFDGAGAPVLTANGAASATKVYDARGNVLAETLLGTDGKPAAGVGGFATKKATYDDRGQRTEEALLGADGRPVVGTDGWSLRRFRFDDVGNTLEQAFFDAEHRLVVPRGSTYASVRSKYDARQRLVEAAYLDAHEVPVNGPDGASLVRYQPDVYGHATEIRYLDASGTPSASSDGKLVVRITYDDAGRPVDERSLDAAGALRAANDGCAEHRTKYDPQGKVVEEDCLGASGAPALSAAGWAARRTQRDIRGNPVNVATFGVDGALHADKDGVARRRSTFDERGDVQETALFDAHDKPTHDRSGLYGTSCSYDEAGHKTGESGLDARGHAMGPAISKSR